MDYPTLDDVRVLAAFHHDCRPQDVPFRDGTGGLADSALSAIQPIFGHDEYPGVATKAAVVGYRFVRNHPLLDANKRTALDLMVLMAALNGSRLHADDGLYDLMLGAASGALDQDEFVASIRPMIRPDPPPDRPGTVGVAADARGGWSTNT